jgi:hypothetical protein
MYLRRLFDVNSARIKNDFDERVLESRRLLERDVRDALTGVLASAESAFEEARRAHAEGADAVRARLEAIDHWRHRAEALR